jgi:hypothetical protein
LETLVALTIVLLMFGMMSSLLVQISNRTYPTGKLKAHELLNSFIISINPVDSLYNSATLNNSASLYNSTKNIDGYKLKSRCTEVDGLPYLLKAKFEIYDENGRLMEQACRFIISQRLDDDHQEDDHQ